MDRNCLGCVHLSLSLGSEWYSDLTPGGPGSISCDKRHFDRNCGDDDKQGVAGDLDRALTCPDYSPETWVKS